MSKEKIDPQSLDVACAESVPVVLSRAADSFRETASEIATDWQDETAGRVWSDIATILDRAAVSCQKAITKRLG